MTLKERIRKKLDDAKNIDFADIAKEIVSEGINDVELMEILPEIVKDVARTRVAAPFFSPAPKVPVTTVVGAKAALLPKSVPVTGASGKVKAYQASRLDELYPVGSGKYKKLSEMNTEDIKFNINMLKGRVKALDGKIRGWNKVLDQLRSYKANTVGDLPDDVKNKI